MALNKLTDLKLESIVSKARKTAQTPDAKGALVGDGSGLYLSITKAGSASWLFRYMVAGKAHTVGLGGYTHLKLGSSPIPKSDMQEPSAPQFQTMFICAVNGNDMEAVAKSYGWLCHWATELLTVGGLQIMRCHLSMVRHQVVGIMMMTPLLVS